MITIDDDDTDMEEVPEAPEETAEAELGTWHYSWVRSCTDHDINRTSLEGLDLTYLCLL